MVSAAPRISQPERMSETGSGTDGKLHRSPRILQKAGADCSDEGKRYKKEESRRQTAKIVRHPAEDGGEGAAETDRDAQSDA